MLKSGAPKLLVGLSASFTGLTVATILLMAGKIVSLQLGTLMLVALVGMHLGFGILIAVYRLINRLN